MQVGTPGQNLRLIPSNSGNAVWPVLPQGCITGDPDNCGDSRGYLFLPNASSTWNNTGLYGLVLTEEAELGYSGNADFGYDDLTLGRPGDGLPTLDHQVIEGFATKDFYIGSFGLSPHAINISTLNNPQPSFLGALAQQSKIPSTSWAYTAGAFYRQPTAFGSLTLGGYDTTRFVQNNVTFSFGPDTNRDLLVPIQSIASGTESLLSTVIYAYIDSLVPHIWLPLSVCQAFEQAFSLTYNETAEIYFVNNTLHDKLISENPNVTFTLGPASGGATVDIVMQYGSFDLLAEYPIVNNATRYYPLKRAQNDSQYTLGRTFLQDAYVIADYDRNNFSVSQAVFPNISNTQQIVTIRRPDDSLLPTHHKTLSTGAIVGIVIAGVMSSLVLGTIIVYIIYKRVQKRSVNSSSRDPTTDRDGSEYRKGELEDTERSCPVEMPVAEPKELTAVEARRPELSAQILYEMLEPPTELEGPSFVHTEQFRESDNPRA